MDDCILQKCIQTIYRLYTDCTVQLQSKWANKEEAMNWECLRAQYGRIRVRTGRRGSIRACIPDSHFRRCFYRRFDIRHWSLSTPARCFRPMALSTKWKDWLFSIKNCSSKVAEAKSFIASSYFLLSSSGLLKINTFVFIKNTFSQIDFHIEQRATSYTFRKSIYNIV